MGTNYCLVTEEHKISNHVLHHKHLFSTITQLITVNYNTEQVPQKQVTSTFYRN